MSRKKQPLAVIDLGAYSAKILTGYHDNGHIVVHKAVKIPIPEDTYGDGEIKKMDTLNEVLKGTFRENHIQEMPTICTIESSSCVIREMTLPAVKAKDLKDMISYEIQNYVPIDLGQYVVQSMIMKEITEGDVNQSMVMVAALPKEIVEDHLALLEGIGMKPKALDIHSNSQSKLLSGARKINGILDTKDRTVAVVDIGHQQINLNIIDRGHYRFSRLLNMGSRDIDTSITNFFGNTIEEARIQKTGISDLMESLSGEDDISRIHNLCRSSVDIWLEEIERIFKFYTSRSTENRIDHILLTGGGARMKGIERYVQSVMGIDVRILQTLEGIVIKDDLKAIDLSKFTNALGAIIRF